MTEQQPSPRTLVYLRVSTDAQDCANQRAACDAYINTHRLPAPVYLDDAASGGTPWRERKLAKIISEAAPGDTILASEVSRIARTTLDALDFCATAAAAGLRVIIAKSALIMDGSIQSKITATVLALAAEIERDLIRSRTRDAVRRRIAAGLPHGRPKGSLSEPKIHARRADIERLLNARVPRAAIARLLGCSRTTLHAYLIRYPIATTPTPPEATETPNAIRH